MRVERWAVFIIIYFVKAAILHETENGRIEEIVCAGFKPGEVRLLVEAALACGTDLKVFKRGYHVRMIVPRALFGHEMAAVIGEVGDGLASRTGGGIG